MPSPTLQSLQSRPLTRPVWWQWSTERWIIWRLQIRQRLRWRRCISRCRRGVRLYRRFRSRDLIEVSKSSGVGLLGDAFAQSNEQSREASYCLFAGLWRWWADIFSGDTSEVLVGLDGSDLDGWSAGADEAREDAKTISGSEEGFVFKELEKSLGGCSGWEMGVRRTTSAFENSVPIFLELEGRGFEAEAMAELVDGVGVDFPLDG